MKILKNNDKNFKELTKGGAHAFILKVIGMGFSYLSMWFVTNMYGAEEWGLYSLGLTVLSIAILIPVFGFDNSIVRIITELNIAKDRKEMLKVIAKIFTLTVGFSLIIIIVINFFSQFISNSLLNQKGFEPFLQIISAAVLPQVFLFLIGAVFQSFKKTIQFMLFKSTLLSTFFFILLVVFYFLDIKASVIEIYFYAILSSFFIAIILVIRLFYHKKKEDQGSFYKTYNFKDLIYLSFPMMLSSSFALLMGWTDILMLSYFGTAKDIGVYNSALKLASVALIALASVNSIASPKFVEFYSKRDFNGLKDVVRKSTKIMFYTSGPFLLILIFFSKTILSIFGPEFVSGYIVLILLCSARFINSVSGSVGYLMQMTDNQKAYQTIMGVAFIINLILNLSLIPKFGINGAAIASSIAMIFWNVALVIIIKVRLGFWTLYIPFISK